MRFIYTYTIFFFLGLSLREASALPPQYVNTQAVTTGSEVILPRRKINIARMGVSAFVNDLRFGSIKSQFKEVKSTLKLKYVRVLFAWNDQVQPTPESTPDFSFYDDIVGALPSGVTALVVLTGVPSWMSDSDNWIDDNPRKTFAELWVRAVMDRYSDRSRIKAYQIWNESNDENNPENATLDVVESPENFVELLTFAKAIRDAESPDKLLVNGATTSINQNFPDTLNYNKDLLSAGILSVIDRYAFHYYGGQIENVLLSGGVYDTLRNINIPIWVTESGAKGISKQRAYVERVWPFLTGLLPNITRFYYYQFTDSTAANQTYGLRNLTPGQSKSDLYRYLKSK